MKCGGSLGDSTIRWPFGGLLWRWDTGRGGVLVLMTQGKMLCQALTEESRIWGTLVPSGMVINHLE